MVPLSLAISAAIPDGLVVVFGIYPGLVSASVALFMAAALLWIAVTHRRPIDQPPGTQLRSSAPRVESRIGTGADQELAA